MAKENSVIIIGAGLAGLSAGCHAAFMGMKPRIFELGNKPGGVCTAWQRNGYTFDGCICWLVTGRPSGPLYKLYSDLGIIGSVKLSPIDTFMRFEEESTSRRFDFTSKCEGVKEVLCAESPKDRKFIEKFLSLARSFGEKQMRVDEPKSLKEALGLFIKWRKLFFNYKVLSTSAGQYVKEASNPWVRNIIVHLFNAETPIVFHMMTAGWLFAGGMARVEGGSLNFARAVEARLKSLGGEVSYGQPVEKVLVEDGRAAGVVLKGGSVIRGDCVISAADLNHTLYELLDGRYVSGRFKDLFRRGRMFEPIVIISFGLGPGSAHYGVKPPLTVFFPRRPLRAGRNDISVMGVRDFSYDPSSAPAGGRVVQAMVETDFDSWNALRSDNINAYREEKKRLAWEVLKRLEYLYPDIGAMVEVSDVATPVTFNRYTNNYRGAYEGWLMDMRYFIRPVEKTLPGLRDFYLAGQWVEPGGGVPAVLISGRKAIKLAAESLKA